MSNKQSGLPFDGQDDQQQSSSLYEKTQQCCGGLCGAFKAWLPCIGCFLCCCSYPYVTVQQGSKGLLLRYKKYIRTLSPGLVYMNSITEDIIQIDCRIALIRIPDQRLMTKDNISIQVQSSIYYHIRDPHFTYFRITDQKLALIKVCGGMIKNTITAFTFQDLLQKKQSIANDIQQQLTPIIKNWGIVVDNVCLKNIGISKQLQTELTSAPVARRNAQAKILNAKGQVQIAKLLSDKSKILDNKTAIQVRYLETLKGLARSGKSRMIYTSS